MNRIRPRMMSVAYRMPQRVADGENDELELQGEQS
jgi:hypothetical protein